MTRWFFRPTAEERASERRRRAFHPEAARESPSVERGVPSADIARDVDDELLAHIDLAREDFVARGMTARDADAAARRRFGNVAAIARICREIDERSAGEQRRARMWMDLRQDVGYAFRMLRRAPGFTAAAIATLALGLGATTAIFSLANWTLLRPVPGVERPAELQQIWAGTRRASNSFTPSFVSYPNLVDVSARLTTAAVAGIQGGTVNVSTGTEAARVVRTQFVSANYFELLGVPFGAGRPFTADEDKPGAPASVAIVSEGFATAVFETAHAALGRQLQINGLPFTVIGIPGRRFAGTSRVDMIDLWLPGTSIPLVNHMPTVRYDERNSGGFYEFVARPTPGATLAQIDAELKAVAAWLAAEYPKENEKFQSVAFHLLGPIGVHPLVRTRMITTVWLMLALSGLVLVIACSNVASLLLMRGIGRQTEVAVRSALGAARFRLVRQHLTEGMVLWLMGGAAGLGVSWLALQAVNGAALLGLPGELGAVPLDWRVITFAAVLSLLVGLGFSLVPAIRAARVELSETLKQATASAAPKNLRVGSALSALQLAMSLTLVVGALLLAATMRQLVGVDVGFDPSGLYSFYVRGSAVGHTPGQAAQYRQEFSRRLSLVNGVERVAMSLRAPFSGAPLFTRIRAVGAETYVRPAATEVLTASYYETLGIPLLKGRTFTDHDLGAAGNAPRPVVVVSARLAHHLFGSADPLGRRIEFGTMGLTGRQFEVIGVVGDVRFRSLSSEDEPMLYQPAGLDSPIRAETMFTLRARPGVDVASEVRSIALALNSALPVVNLVSMRESIEAEQAEWALLARLLTTLAVIAGALAAVGLYGVISFGVAARSREFGVRLALGASPRRIVVLVMRRTAVIALVGLGLGCGGAVALSRALESRLVGVTRFDPLVWTLAAVVFLLTAFLAAWIPARRAAAVEVTTALRVV